MGDKSFITRPPFHEKFLSTISRPNLELDRPILVPPLTSNYQLVGIAYDYLLRFYLERINVGSKTSEWAAEEGVILLEPFEGASDAYEKAKSYLAEARKQYQLYIQNGFLTDELISAALCLAHLEGARRSGVFNEARLMALDERDVADLRELMSVVQEHDFTSRKACYLNPKLGSTRSNADLIIDDKLIDIKTTKDLVLDRRHLHQLVHYYILLSLEGIDVGRERHINYFEEVGEVNHICIYFSRHGYLHSMKVTDLINTESLSGFVKWYVETRCPSEDERLAYCRKSYGIVPKNMIKEIQAARRSKKRKVPRRT
jgi:hypothetical protein